MSQVVIRQSGKRGSGILIVIAVLAAIGFAKYGPRIGRMQDAQEREADKRIRVRQLLERTDDNLENLRVALQESNAAERFLESLPKPVPESPPAEPAKAPPPTSQPALAPLPE
jgi:hypothetical protein